MFILLFSVIIIAQDQVPTAYSQGFEFGSDAISNSNTTILPGVELNEKNISIEISGENLSSISTQKPRNNASGVVVWTNRPNYVIGQEVQIFVHIFDEKPPDKAQLNIEVTNAQLLYNISLLAPKNTFTLINGLNTQSQGTYNIKATVVFNGKEETDSNIYQG